MGLIREKFRKIKALSFKWEYWKIPKFIWFHGTRLFWEQIGSKCRNFGCWIATKWLLECFPFSTATSITYSSTHQQHSSTITVKLPQSIEFQYYEWTLFNNQNERLDEAQLQKYQKKTSFCKNSSSWVDEPPMKWTSYAWNNPKKYRREKKHSTGNSISTSLLKLNRPVIRIKSEKNLISLTSEGIILITTAY